MNRKTREHLNRAIKYTETQRYRLGINEFVYGLIDNWAFEQTGLYPPNPILGFDEEAILTAKQVSHELATAMKINPTSDVLGWYLSETGLSKNTESFFPTPPEVSRLISSLTIDNKKQSKDKYYECCCGSGSLALSYLDNIFEKDGKEALKNIELYLEDINPTIIKCALLQILFFIDVKGVQIKSFSIATINSLTRKNIGPHYYAQTQ